MHHERNQIMAKKADLLAQATELGLEATEKNTIAELESMINGVGGPDDAGAGQKAAETTEEAKTAKAGKRSAKAIAEAEEKVAKEERKEAGADAEKTEADKPRHIQKTRTKLERSGKKFREASELVDANIEYSIKDALELATKTTTTKFDSTVELHVRLNVDPKQADQNIRETLILPAGTGKKVRIAVFAEEDDVATAKKAGADLTNKETFMAVIKRFNDLIDQLEKTLEQ